MNPSEPIAGFEQIDIAKSLEEGTTRTTSITTTTTSSTSLPPLKTTSSANPSIFTTKIKILILLALTFFLINFGNNNFIFVFFTLRKSKRISFLFK
uniref:Uncharacterized protein n=1 Tax=Meloidogyne enterolobii TaxID=390850 RepID=A0A6V7U6H1_MELEN|nr:unnamed protein product [Meloidogyne enterolobii]